MTKSGGAKRVAVVIIGVLLLGISSMTSASASVTWSTWCAGYTGNSWYNTAHNVGWALTVANDNDKVGAAVRYYQGAIPYTTGNGYAERSRTGINYGGYHRSYCGITLTKSSNV